MSFPKVSLGSVAKIVNGGTPDTKAAAYWDGGIAWLTPKDMGKSTDPLMRHTSRTISEAGLSNSSARLVPPGSVILSTRAPIGHLALNDIEMAFNQGCRGLVPSAKLDAKFLYHFLKASIGLLNDLGTGTTFKELSASALANVQIPLPPLAEQQRIVAILDEAFEDIAIATAMTARCATNASQIAWQYLADVFEQSGSDWIREPIFKRVRFVDYRGKTPPKRAAGVRLITAKNVKMGFVQRSPEEFIDEGAYAGWMTRGYPARGDVLFTTEAPLANVAQLDTDEPVVIGQRLITMQADKDRLAPTFLKYMLLSRPLQSAIRAKGTGATVQGIKASLLKQIEIMYPPSLDMQSAIVARLDVIFERSEALARLHQRKLSAFAELKKSLLASAFAGELTGESAAANDDSFATPEQAANILAFMHWRHERANRGRFFGHVMAQKTLDLVERVGGVELGRRPYKDAAGPNDKPHMTRAEVWARDNQFFEFVERTGGGYDFKKLANYGATLSVAKTALKPIEAELGRVANILVGKDKVQAEIFATVLAAWNNLIIDGKDATEAAILREARDDWHPDKIDLPVAKFQDAIREIRRLALVPDGTAKAVRHKQAALF